MEIMIETTPYFSLNERFSLVTQQESKGFTMLTDDYLITWQHGDEPQGVMRWTDIPIEIRTSDPDKTAYANAETDQERLNIISRRLGLI
jgi:hypothetical protein